MSRRLVEVALPPPLARQLTYAVPSELTETVGLGSVVLVPVQQRLVTGFVVAEDPPAGDLSERAIREISQLIDGALLSPEIVQLCHFLADYYLAPLGSALAAALPPGVHITSRRRVRRGTKPPADGLDPLSQRLIDEVSAAASPLTVTTLKRRLGGRGLEAALRRLSQAGAIDVQPDLQDASVSQRMRQTVQLIDPRPAEEVAAELSRAPRQAACVTALAAAGGRLPKQQLVEDGYGYAILQALQRRGIVDTVDEQVIRDPLANLTNLDAPDLVPTQDQQAALDSVSAAVEKSDSTPILLRGVTGSGKTLVYLRSIEHALSLNRSAIVLVPEIALAWQMVRRFRTHFGEQVAVLHSQLSLGERFDTWQRLRRGEQRIVIGARSALFAPVRDLGILVVDEEHDGSYFQDDLDSKQPLAYSARDLAVVRSRLAGAAVVLGSATPSLESFWNVRRDKYRLAALPSRVDNRPLPTVEVVDMRQEPFQRRERVMFSKTLRLKIRKRLERGEQIVLLQNRRGFAPVVQCGDCGESVECPRCGVSLTCHGAQIQDLRCHYCDHRQPVPDRCAHCQSMEVKLQGVGTQKVETALEEQFPDIRVIRMDVDTTGWKGAHDELVERFRRREADVLLGTQMVAKGLDFPDVTLVGVISADTGLHMPDFRAAERSFQLLTQVAGRSGRGDQPGEVVIQTRLPDEAVLQAAAQQDFDAFVENELVERRAAGFPPFGRLVVFRWRGDQIAAVERAAHEGVIRLRQTCKPGVQLLGPAPAPLARLRGRHRWQALLMGPSAQALRQTTLTALTSMRQASSRFDVDLAVVVDPQTTM
ncbi:MAG TPA: primosomal protein N' [Candidatus Latescibacteria bacterium]|nr:primosomal protein N' [Gemmatimonadota bacterium]MDP7361856.1 primosomal protein N' [Candidatus Latescibacterota bacterium]HCV25064.1 primosomal protein N' [Candidatus Latescibacterota bacterium]HJN28761.1 primosomal protein N' [Candidatus Latescibacterota bacterium]